MHEIDHTIWENRRLIIAPAYDIEVCLDEKALVYVEEIK